MAESTHHEQLGLHGRPRDLCYAGKEEGADSRGVSDVVEVDVTNELACDNAFESVLLVQHVQVGADGVAGAERDEGDE